jgi:DivIVA domain-containing protein
VPLTPTDVANKQFRIAFRGYSLDEVDAFLDEVETELTRLLRERSAGAPPAPVPAAAVAAPAPVQLPAPAPAATGMEGQESALRTLLLAQRTADAAIAEAKAEADELLTSARSEAERAVEEARKEASSSLQGARAEAESTLTGARTEAERTLTAARTEAQQTLTAARERAAAMDAETAAKVEAATGGLEVRRRQLEGRIEELRAFEREYRTRLKAYLETQLRELGSGPSTGDEAGVGVPADARAAAVASGSFGRRPVEGGGAAQAQPQSAQPQPVQPQPVQAQPVQGQPVQGQPVQGQPVQVQPAHPQAARPPVGQPSRLPSRLDPSWSPARHSRPPGRRLRGRSDSRSARSPWSATSRTPLLTALLTPTGLRSASPVPARPVLTGGPGRRLACTGPNAEPLRRTDQ